MQFCWDVANTAKSNKESMDNAKRWVKHMSTDDEMLRLHELICENKKRRLFIRLKKF